MGSGCALQTDVLIVGAGPTGLLLANLLGTMGVATTLIEKHQTTVQDPRAVSIDDESMRALQAADLADDVARIIVQGYGSIYRGPSGRSFASVTPTTKDYGFDKRNAFEQPVFEGILRESLRRHPSLTVWFDTELVDFEQTNQTVQASVTCGGGPTQQIEARYMIACDGGRSPVRKALGIAMDGASFAEPWLIVDLKNTLNRCFHTEVFCDPARSCITLPGPDGIRRYEFKLRVDENADSALKEPFVRGLLATVGPDRDQPLRRVRVYTFQARMANCWRQGSIFLAGDAAHLTPPFAGQGMNSGLRDAHNLAWKLAEALRCDQPEELLQSYESERKPHAWSLICLAIQMGRVMMPQTPMRSVAIRSLFRLLNFYPPAREYVVQMKYKPKPRFAQGLVWHSDRARKKSVVGQLLPQPFIQAVDRSVARLDEVLPDCPVLLIFSKTPETELLPDLQKQFSDAGIFVVGITPDSINPVLASFPIFRDQSRGLSKAPYAAYVGYGLMIRRDRYVAAASPVSKLKSLIEIGRRLSPGHSASHTIKAMPPVKGADRQQSIAETA